MNTLQEAWMKYKWRKQALADAGKKPHYKLSDRSEEWYSIEAYREGIHYRRGRSKSKKP